MGRHHQPIGNGKKPGYTKLEHKISRAVVNWAKERQVSTLVIGDGRAVADGKRLATKSQQKIGLWSHGRQRSYITYKARQRASP